MQGMATKNVKVILAVSTCLTVNRVCAQLCGAQSAEKSVNVNEILPGIPNKYESKLINGIITFAWSVWAKKVYTATICWNLFKLTITNADSNFAVAASEAGTSCRKNRSRERGCLCTM